MAKFFAVTIIAIAILSAIPILRHTWWMAEDISTHGAPIDEQMSETMAEAGISFLASQFILAFFIWKFSNPRPGEKVKNFPGGAKAMVWAAVLLVGTEVLALGVFGVKAWANVYFTPPSADAMPIQVQAGQFAFYFRYPGPDGKFGPIHPDLISEATQNFYGLDMDHDPGFERRHRDRTNGRPGEPRDPFAHALEGRRAFVFRSGVAGAAGFRSRAGSFFAFHRDQGWEIRDRMYPALRSRPLQHEGLPFGDVPAGL